MPTFRRTIVVLLMTLAALAVRALPAHATLVDIGAGLTGVVSGCGAWGDYDGDGDLDLAVIGNSVAGPFGRVYRNTGGTFTPAAYLPPMASGKLAWGDYDGDGDLDLAITGSTGSASITRVLRNDGADTLVSVVALEGLTESAVAWGDCDGDGDLDLAVAGWNGTTPVARIYRNDGRDVFTDLAAGLTGVRHAALAWCDADRDGDLDLVVAGALADGSVATTLYLNDGAGAFHAATAPFLGAKDAALAWADWDQDGDPDLLVDGFGATAPIGRIYRNAGNGTFADAGASLQALVQCSAMWGDADADGDPDLVVSGSSGSAPLTILFANTNGVMSNQSAMLPGVWNSSVAWGDYDDDGRLDLFVAGGATPTSGQVARIYHNTGTPMNTPPSPPSGLFVTHSADSVTFHWSPGSDDPTPSTALGYNLWVGRTATTADVVSPMADLATGHRRLAAPGNVGQRLQWTLARGAVPNAFAWGVQAIDASYAGSSFATRTSEVLAVEGAAAPRDLALRIAGPNPFTRGVALAVTLDRARDVRVTVTDVAGRLVRTLATGAWPAGTRELRWDGTGGGGRPAAAGVYFVRLDAGDASRMLRVLKLR